MSLAIKVLTLFPDMVRTVLETSILGRAEVQGQVRYEVTDIRDFAVDKHRTVDDTAYGGGAGMIMMAPPIVEAVEKVRRRDDATVILTTPQGRTLDEDLTLDLAGLPANLPDDPEALKGKRPLLFTREYFASFVDAIDRVAVGQISGPVGTFAHIAPAVEAKVCQRLGLKVSPVSTQVRSYGLPRNLP